MIRRVIEAAFLSRRQKNGAADGSSVDNFAILPQQSEDELLISEVHTKLDKVLSFLQRDVGYTLLQDAKPNAGGGVCLERRPSSLPGVPSKSGRLPKEEPSNSHDDAHSEVVVNNQAGMKQVIRFKPDTAKYAHFPDDLVLVWRFAHMLGEACPEASSKVQNDLLYKTVMQGVRLMHLCDYNYSDVVVTLAYASVYFRTIFESIGERMSEYEAAHVCVLLIYLAHSFLLDETCPLRCWQKYIFRKYCTLKVLDAALFRLFSMRKEYGLRISTEEEKYALSVLLYSPAATDVRVSLGDTVGHIQPDVNGSPRKHEKVHPKRSGESASSASPPVLQARKESVRSSGSRHANDTASPSATSEDGRRSSKRNGQSTRSTPVSVKDRGVARATPPSMLPMVPA